MDRSIKNIYLAIGCLISARWVFATASSHGQKEKAFTVRNTWRDEFYADGKEFNYFHKEYKFCSFLIFEDETTGCEIERNISV